jgi:hypothetical protein
MDNLTQEQQDRLTTSELRYYQLNYGDPRFERRMQRLIDIVGPTMASEHADELVKQIMRIYGNTELTEKYTRKLNLVVCDCEGPHFVGSQISCRGLNGENATGIYAK